MIHDFVIDELGALCRPGSLRLQYVTDGADSCEFELVVACDEVPGYVRGGVFYAFAPGDVLLLRDGEGRCVFRGVMPNGVSFGLSAGSSKRGGLAFYSDMYLLERTAYLRLTADGVPIYPGSGRGANFVDVGEFCGGVFEWCTGWTGSRVGCGFLCRVSGDVPVPEGNGMTSCAAVLGDAVRWLPGAFLVQRYGAEQPVLQLTDAAQEGEVVLGLSDELQGVSLTERVEAVPPVCALVGGDHFVLPDGGDVREPGAFVFAVPSGDFGENGGVAGGAEASSKMVLKGVALPERYIFERGESENVHRAITANGATWQWIERFFPEFAPFLEKMECGAALVEVVPRGVVADALREDSVDADGAGVPDNYSEPPWSTGTSGGMYVLTEGSFVASARMARNLKGLSWCKARVCLNVRVSDLGDDRWKPLLAVAEEIFPGRRYSAKYGKNTHLTARLVLDCVLINKRKRVYDPATNAPCSTDPEYVAEDGVAPLASEYRLALSRFYEASRKAPFEGQVTMFYREGLRPDELVGKGVRIEGLRPEWASMTGAVVRGVQWDVMSGVVALNVGGGGTLSYDEHLQRLMLARRARVDAAQRLAVPMDVADEVGREELEGEMSVSPSISASVGATVAGVIAKPWTLYTTVEGEGAEKVSVVWLAGGTLRRGGQVWHVEDTRYQIEGGAQTQMPWARYGNKPRIIWKWVGGSAQEWTFDIKQ